MLTETEVLEIFKSTQALLEGHFKLTSGMHSGKYMQCAKVLQYPHYATKLGAALAEKYLGDKIDVVVGPALGGILVAHEVARALGVRAVFTERENGEMTLRRGFEIRKKERVLVVEDVVTTGGSVKEVIEVVKKKGAALVGVGVLVNRSGGKADFGTRLESLLYMNIVAHDPANCPLCQEGMPLVKPGSRQFNPA